MAARRNVGPELPDASEVQALSQEEEKPKLHPLSYSARMKSTPPLSGFEFHLDSAMWLTAGSIIWYLSDFHNVLLSSPDLLRPVLALSIVLAVAAVSVVIYLQYVLPLVWGVRIPFDRWEVEYPWAFPIASVLLVLSGVACTIAFWPCFQLFTPIVMFFLGMALFTILLYIRF